MTTKINAKATEKTIFNVIGTKIRQVLLDNTSKYIGFRYTNEVKFPECRPVDGNHEILLPISSKGDGIKTVYELAHECIHLITPVDKNNVNYFEEGLATKFQLDFIKKYKHIRAQNGEIYYDVAMKKLRTEDEKYFRAYDDIEKIERLSTKTIYEICKELFQKDLIISFAQITPEILEQVTGIKDNDELLIRVCEKFYT